MANLTLSIDDNLLRKGREYAAKRGMSLTALVRGFLAEVTSRSEAEVEEVVARLRASPGNSKGVPFNRDELYEGRV